MTSRTGVASADDPSYRASARLEVLRLLPALPAGAKVLEIGCGEGAFSLQIPGAAELWGIEPEPRSAAVARTRLHRVFEATFDEVAAELPRRRFDLVVCNDVIEHMTDHDAFLRAIQAHMAPGAFLVGSLPNVRFYGNLFNLLVARDWHYRDSGILDRTHFRFFTFRSLRRSLEGSGFEVRRLEGLNPGVRHGWSPRALAERALRHALVALSLGAGRDVDFLQIGFVATPRG